MLVVAIDGPGASGKTTIAGPVAEMIDAAVVHADDFFSGTDEDSRLASETDAYVESSLERAASAVAPAEGTGPPGSGPAGAGPAGAGPPGTGDPLARYYDREALREQALGPLRAGRPATFARRHWDRPGVVGPQVVVAPRPVVVVEGVSTTAPALADLVDRTVFVQTPEALRLRRLRNRIAAPSWDERWLEAERRYFATRPPEAFDLVVAGAPSGFARSGDGEG